MAKMLVIVCIIPNLEVQRLYLIRSPALSIDVQGKPVRHHPEPRKGEPDGTPLAGHGVCPWLA